MKVNDETCSVGLATHQALAYGEADARATDATGSRAGPYRLTRRLGQGGGGSVYEACGDDGELCAVKVMLPATVAHPELIARFAREAQTLRAIDHPNIVAIYSSGSLQDGSPYYAMELLDGPNLAEIIEERGRLTAAEALTLLRPVCDALKAAHDLGIVHRDLKASNIVVLRDAARTVKLLDFGIAKLMEPDPSQKGLTAFGTQLGTPQSMAPEQVRCEAIDARTDVYGLGILLFHLLTGNPPFHALTPEEVMRAHLSEPPPRPSWNSPTAAEVDRVVLRCLEKLPDRRYSGPETFIDALDKAVNGGTSTDQAEGSTVVAVYVEAWVDPQGELDEEATDDAVMTLLDGAAEAYADHEFELAVELGTAVLLVRSDALSDADVDAAHQLGLELLDQFQGTVRPRIAIRRGAAQLCDGELVGGEIADIEAWVGEDSAPGVRVIPDAGSGEQPAA